MARQVQVQGVLWIASRRKKGVPRRRPAQARRQVREERRARVAEAHSGRAQQVLEQQLRVALTARVAQVLQGLELARELAAQTEVWERARERGVL